MIDRQPARAVCATLLQRWIESGDFPDRMLPDGHPSVALIQEIVYGCIRWKQALLWRLQQLAPRKPDPQTTAFLLVGLYQLFYLDHVPPHAAVHETVEAAKRTLDPARCRFLNAVLRNALRKKPVLEQHLQATPPATRLSHPPALITRWTRHYGAAATEALCNWNNARPTVSIRLFEQHPESGKLAAALAPHPAAPQQFRIVPPGTKLSALPGFETGSGYIQDPATALAVDLLDVQPGMRVLDACAAPGGKTFACADRMQNQGEIVAMDCHRDRLQLVHQNLARMGFSCIRVRRGNATQADLFPAEERFDRMLLDVPCSNSGVLQRRPDARWRFSPQRLAGLVKVQRQMLDVLCAYLKPGGILVYSTCSLEPEENEEQVQDWVGAHSGFTLDTIQRSIPPRSGMDGAFAARLIRHTAADGA